MWKVTGNTNHGFILQIPTWSDDYTIAKQDNFLPSIFATLPERFLLLQISHLTDKFKCLQNLPAQAEGFIFEITQDELKLIFQFLPCGLWF